MIDELGPDHIRVLRAMKQPPTPVSLNETPPNRLGNGIDQTRLTEIVDDLNSMRLTLMERGRVNLIGHPTLDFRQDITAFGDHFLRYID
jgi:hypothetical protein